MGYFGSPGYCVTSQMCPNFENVTILSVNAKFQLFSTSVELYSVCMWNSPDQNFYGIAFILHMVLSATTGTVLVEKNWTTLPLPWGVDFGVFGVNSMCNYGACVLTHSGCCNSVFCVFDTSEKFSLGYIFWVGPISILGPGVGAKSGRGTWQKFFKYGHVIYRWKHILMLISNFKEFKKKNNFWARERGGNRWP